MPEQLFQRQRRNVILMASVVIFINTTGAKLAKVNILGNMLDIANPTAMPKIFGIVLGYFLWRYFQYTHEIENKGFKERFHRRAEHYLGPYLLKREFLRKDSKLAQHFSRSKDIKVNDVTMFHSAMPPNTAAASFEHKDDMKVDGVIDENELHVSDVELILPFIRASIYIVVRTRLVTDYVFPPMFAVLAFSTYFSCVQSLLKSWL
ncbi:hypothetical protein [Sideroxydans sp. CL21]|uniref:hypothetical protein n=1 Tax=Sideroxydans sp. CL21 TaxID=2600596 RepID=UPI0024BC6150|nr:hypothetical protein [Sideroxydans sp. CL21]